MRIRNVELTTHTAKYKPINFATTSKKKWSHNKINLHPNSITTSVQSINTCTNFRSLPPQPTPSPIQTHNGSQRAALLRAPISVHNVANYRCFMLVRLCDGRRVGDIQGIWWWSRHFSCGKFSMICTNCITC